MNYEIQFFGGFEMHKCSESGQTSIIALAMCDIFFWLICKFFGQNMTFLRFPFFKKCTICYTLYYTSIKMSISFLRRKVLYCPVEFISRLKPLSHWGNFWSYFLLLSFLQKNFKVHTSCVLLSLRSFLWVPLGVIPAQDCLGIGWWS